MRTYRLTAPLLVQPPHVAARPLGNDLTRDTPPEGLNQRGRWAARALDLRVEPVQALEKPERR
jgi:hypothetical protein